MKGAKRGVEHVSKRGRRAGYAGQENGLRKRGNGMIPPHK